MPPLDEKLAKRRADHAMTIGVWLSSSAAEQQPGEDAREYRRRLISLGAWHAMSPANAPLLRAIAEAAGVQVTAVKISIDFAGDDAIA